ncbi:hypothetical protein [Anaeromyxobacter sp. SG66]|uniref:hypothetical protein n=1 Tax=Anaeromyxobacter sp. SG66 TaxID=2925410 RepID=UPI001F5825F7|nr:hypothetical protein [Anaeromyxobacter sp. SG66]
MSDDAIVKPESLVALEAEERLAALSDQAARFAELTAAGTPVEEAYARAGFTDGSAHALATRHDVLAAISALRERNLGERATDVVYLRRLLHGAAHFAFRDQDHRGVTNVVRLLAELDQHLEKKKPTAPESGNFFFSIAFARPMPPAVDVEPPTIDVTPIPTAVDPLT